jgi:hypothetical protein
MNPTTDVLIIGGSLGGVAAALAVTRVGYTVILTEETNWLGGQLTAQGVPLDEHPWMESFGCTRSYRSLRNGIRSYYLKHYPLTSRARAMSPFNPGAAMISRLSCEPRVAVAVIESMLAPFRASGRLKIMLRNRVEAVEMNGDRAIGATLRNLDTGDRHTIRAPYILDATELGDVLPLADIEYVSGSESQDETGEPHAGTGPARPLNIQSFNMAFAIDYLRDESHTIDKPENYDFWRSFQADFEPAPHLSWEHPGITFELFPDPHSGKFSIWRFRRILYGPHFEPGSMPSDVTVINTALNDYWLGRLIDVSDAEAQENIKRAKQLSLSMLYWLQAEAPRPDGGVGWPGLRFRPDILDTHDGFAKYPYIRESRRIKAEFTVLEQHLGVEARKGLEGAESYHDTVGIGNYRILLHPTTEGDPSLNLAAWPFQIPLGALIPIRVENVLPACKNIGVTHITNGCFRLHPVEWNIGEAVGTLAAFCLEHHLLPRQVRNEAKHLEGLQTILRRMGVEMAWPRCGPGTSYMFWAFEQDQWTWGESDTMGSWW